MQNDFCFSICPQRFSKHSCNYYLILFQSIIYIGKNIYSSYASILLNKNVFGISFLCISNIYKRGAFFFVC